MNSEPKSIESFRPSMLSVIAWPLLAVVSFFVSPQIGHRTMIHFLGILAVPSIATMAILVWWLRSMKGQGVYRWLPVPLMFVPAFILAVTAFKGDPKWAFVFGTPVVGLAWVVWLLLSYPLRWPPRRLGSLITIVLTWCGVSLVRVDGTDAEIMPELSWRWKPTADQLYEQERAARAKASSSPASPTQPVAEKLSVGPNDWAEFRGPNRDNIVRGIRINTDWRANPPKQLWKQRIGPGWGAFAVVGSRIFTLEQRGDKEAVVCLDFATGNELWSHEYAARFFEQIAGAGPRSTPTVADGRVYSLGATGQLTCLDALTGAKIWATDVTKDTGGQPPQWGYASSPLVIAGKAIVYVGGQPDKGTAAFNITDGSLAWAAGTATHCYTSAQKATLGGIEQVLQVSNKGVESFRASDGHRYWIHDWPVKDVNRATQAVIVNETDLILGSGVGTLQASRRLKVTPPKGQSPTDLTLGNWGVDELWTSKAIKPYFNDSIVHDGHLYGFDDKKLVCVDVANGKQKWSTGAEYGHGQVIVLADQGVLVVQAVDGKVALVEANPNEHVEITKFPALKGKTWNHPIVAHGRLLVRNAEEVACYELVK